MRRRFTPMDDEAQIDLTPMLDVVFIMLIFFIVTASFVREAGLLVNRPDQTPPDQKDEKKKNVLVSITANGQIYINRQPRIIDISSVQANIARLVAANPEASVVIQAEPGAKVGIYTQVHDAAILSNAAGVVLTTEQ